MKLNKPKVPSTIVLIDIDGTIFDREYKLTVDENAFRKAILNAQKQGVLVGVSSDSAPNTIARLMHRYGMDGPLVAEKGAVVYMNVDKYYEALCVAGHRSATLFELVRLKFIQIWTSHGHIALVGDVNNVSRHIEQLVCNEQRGTMLLLVNGYRTASLSFYAYEATQNKELLLWKRSPKALRVALQMSMKVLQTTSILRKDLLTDMNASYGICIIHKKQTAKKEALPTLRKVYGTIPIAVIGDSSTDDHTDKTVYHCAVSNASSEYKSRCAFVASRSYTAGVIDALKHIRNTLGKGRQEC
jgi:hydroxymethylpyrimidine pyrophosphatase-like HAD family hydrolase